MFHSVPSLLIRKNNHGSCWMLTEWFPVGLTNWCVLIAVTERWCLLGLQQLCSSSSLIRQPYAGLKAEPFRCTESLQTDHLPNTLRCDRRCIWWRRGWGNPEDGSEAQRAAGSYSGCTVHLCSSPWPCRFLRTSCRRVWVPGSRIPDSAAVRTDRCTPSIRSTRPSRHQLKHEDRDGKNRQTEGELHQRDAAAPWSEAVTSEQEVERRYFFNQKRWSPENNRVSEFKLFFSENIYIYFFI